MKFFYASLLLIALTGNSAETHAQPLGSFPVLKVSEGEKSIILIGSNHTAPVTAYGDTAAKILTGAKALCLEAKPDEKVAATKAAQVTMLNLSGRTLAQRHGQLLAQEVSNALAWNKFISEKLDNFSDQALGTFLWLMPLNTRDAPPPQMSPNNSIDAKLIKLAEQDHLKLVSIEDLDAIPKAAATISPSEWEDYLRKSVEFAKCPDCVRNFSRLTLLQYAPSADYDAAYQAIRGAFGSNEKLFDYYDRINMRTRNFGLAQNIKERAVEGSECGAVAIGAAHLGGPNGVVPLLRKMGLTVVPLSLSQ